MQTETTCGAGHPLPCDALVDLRDDIRGLRGQLAELSTDIATMQGRDEVTSPNIRHRLQSHSERLRNVEQAALPIRELSRKVEKLILWRAKVSGYTALAAALGTGAGAIVVGLVTWYIQRGGM